MRPDWKLWAIVPLLCCFPLTASADDSDAAKLVSECSAPDLPQSSLDSCLERIRVHEETDPSAELQSLEASLERRASGVGASGYPTTRAEQALLPPVEPASPEAVPSMNGTTSDESAADDRTQSQRLTGPDADDEPPIADSDDPAPPDRMQSDDADNSDNPQNPK